MFYYWNLRMDGNTADRLKRLSTEPVSKGSALASVTAGTGTECVELNLMAKPSLYFGNTELYATAQFNNENRIDGVADVPNEPAITLLHRTTPLGTGLFGAMELSVKETEPALTWTNTAPGEYLASVRGAKIRIRQYMTDSRTDWDVRFDNPAKGSKYPETLYFEADTLEMAKKTALRRIGKQLEDMRRDISELGLDLTRKLISIQDEALQEDGADDIVCRAVAAMRRYGRKHQAIVSDEDGVIRTPKPFRILSACAGHDTVRMKLYFPESGTDDVDGNRIATILYIETNRIAIPE